MQPQADLQDEIADIATATLLGVEFYQYKTVKPIGWWVIDSWSAEISLTNDDINAIGTHPTKAACAKAFVEWYSRQPQKVTL